MEPARTISFAWVSCKNQALTDSPSERGEKPEFDPVVVGPRLSHSFREHSSLEYRAWYESLDGPTTVQEFRAAGQDVRDAQLD